MVLGSVVWGLGFGVWGLGLRVEVFFVLGFRVSWVRAEACSREALRPESSFALEACLQT